MTSSNAYEKSERLCVLESENPLRKIVQIDREGSGPAPTKRERERERERKKERERERKG